MSEDTFAAPSSVVRLTIDVVCAYVAKHHLPASEVPGLLTTVHGAIHGLATGGTAAPVEAQIERLSAAQIRKSITPAALISFIDGKPYKTLKRHLTKHGFTPDTYRERFGLPHDYPTVSANYSEHRSTLAKSLGLGVSGRTSEAAEEAHSEPAKNSSARKAA